MKKPIVTKCLALCAAALSLGVGFNNQRQAAAQTKAARPGSAQFDGLHGVISRSELTPHLNSAAALLRFSPNGQYLFAQNRNSIYVLDAKTLRVKLSVQAVNVYPARFSADSESITLMSRDLAFGIWRVRDGQKLSGGQIAIHEGCLKATLTTDGERVACFLPDFEFRLYELATGKIIFSVKSPRTVPVFALAPVSFAPPDAFANPLGYYIAKGMDVFANQDAIYIPMLFSPDGNTLIAGNEQNSFQLDLKTFQKSDLSATVLKYLRSSVCFLPGSRLLALPTQNDKPVVVLSLNRGNVLSTLDFKADAANLASAPRYLLLTSDGNNGHRVFDADQGREIEIPENGGIDILGGVLAVYKADGHLSLYKIGEKSPITTTSLRFDDVILLQAAAVSSSLDRLAISVAGSGGVFGVPDGQSIANMKGFAVAGFSDTRDAYVVLPGAGPNSPAQMLRWDTSARGSMPSPAWSRASRFLRGGGNVLLEYSYENPFRENVPPVSGPGRTPFSLQAIDLPTNKELWKRRFASDAPVLFADPQGDRFILGWNAKSGDARKIASHLPVISESFRKAKITDKDSFFEALDARTGQSVGGVLVQVGMGPMNFETVFSVGDALLIAHDDGRISLYSLRDGQLKAHLSGIRPSASAESNLIALSDGSTLTIYDSQTGSRLDRQDLPDVITYTRFSADGKRLLALTRFQTVYVLDVSAVRQPRAADAP